MYMGNKIGRDRDNWRKRSDRRTTNQKHLSGIKRAQFFHVCLEIPHPRLCLREGLRAAATAAAAVTTAAAVWDGGFGGSGRLQGCDAGLVLLLDALVFLTFGRGWCAWM